MPIDIPHLAVPLHLAGDRLACVEQDTPDEIAACAETIVRYRPGDRDDLPDFGVPDLTFTIGDPSEEIATVIGDWEPRADTLVGADRDRLDESIEEIRVEVGTGG